MTRAAEKLLRRIRRGDWYPAYSPRTPKAMKELEDAGLVQIMGRIKVIEACYVPTGTKQFKFEEYPL